jgi:hypothetical protein
MPSTPILPTSYTVVVPNSVLTTAAEISGEEEFTHRVDFGDGAEWRAWGDTRAVACLQAASDARGVREGVAFAIGKRLPPGLIYGARLAPRLLIVDHPEGVAGLALAVALLARDRFCGEEAACGAVRAQVEAAGVELSGDKWREVVRLARAGARQRGEGVAPPLVRLEA